MGKLRQLEVTLRCGMNEGMAVMGSDDLSYPRVPPPALLWQPLQLL